MQANLFHHDGDYRGGGGEQLMSADQGRANATSTAELVHVLAVYDYENKVQYLYINGVAVDAGKTFTGEFAPATDASGVFNQFALGADAYTGSTPDFLSPNMTMVDAKNLFAGVDRRAGKSRL